MMKAPGPGLAAGWSTRPLRGRHDTTTASPVSPLLLLQQRVGNAATTALVQRWWQPDPPDAEPNPNKPPPAGVRWKDVGGDPRQAYRFVDAKGQGWESPGHPKPFAKSDWNVRAAIAKGWVDESGTARADEMPEHYRPALADERQAIAQLGKAPVANDTQVYVPRSYKRTPGRANRPAEQRMMDRIARVLKSPMTEETATPHLATLLVGGTLEVAGNTGARRVTAQEQQDADAALAAALDRDAPLPEGRRAKKDVRKLRALLSGDYQAAHPGQTGLKGIATVLEGGTPAWSNVDVEGAQGEGVAHGELTVIGDLIVHMRANRGDPRNKTTLSLGGVKLNCKACWLTLEVVNERIAGPLGYHIRSSGTHEGYFKDWQAPGYITGNPNALAALDAKLRKDDWHLDKQHRLRSDFRQSASDPVKQNPEESESEWEEEPEHTPSKKAVASGEKKKSRKKRRGRKAPQEGKESKQEEED